MEVPFYFETPSANLSLRILPKKLKERDAQKLFQR